MLAIYALSLVILLLIFRRIGKFEVPIWASMTIGALIVIAGGAIGIENALGAIDLNVILFLFGAFAIARALEMSGLLEEFAYRALKRAKNYDELLLIVLFGAGILSALLMNDTLAVVGTPIVILIARKLGLGAKPFLLALAFAVTIGSVFSPVGNPQNLLIATKSSMASPFVLFAQHLFLPSLLNLVVAFFLLKLLFKQKGVAGRFELPRTLHMVRDSNLAAAAKVSVALFVLLILAHVVTGVLGFETALPLPAISVVAALPLFIFSRRRFELLRTLEWGTLLMFASMFVLMQAVWDDGLFQSLIPSIAYNAMDVGAILLLSALVSQFVSNVPFTALYLPLLSSAGAATREYLALAAGATLAGNLTLMGAASNLIIVAGAEARGERITFFEFMKIGVVLTALNLLIVFVFLSLA